MIGKGLMLLGAGVAGGGIYGLLLYDFTAMQSLGAIAGGFLLIGVGLLLGGTLQSDK